MIWEVKTYFFGACEALILKRSKTALIRRKYRLKSSRSRAEGARKKNEAKSVKLGSFRPILSLQNLVRDFLEREGGSPPDQFIFGLTHGRFFFQPPYVYTAPPARKARRAPPRAPDAEADHHPGGQCFFSLYNGDSSFCDFGKRYNEENFMDICGKCNASHEFH